MGWEIGDASVVVAIHPPSVRAKIRVLRLVNRKVKLLGFRWSGNGYEEHGVRAPARSGRPRCPERLGGSPRGAARPVRSARRCRESSQRGGFGDVMDLGEPVHG